jgi:hypothetical protein
LQSSSSSSSSQEQEKREKKKKKTREKKMTKERMLTVTHQWTGIMGFSIDTLPWVGPLPSPPSPPHHQDSKAPSTIYTLAGYTGHGMPNAWLCGKSIVTIMLEEDDTVEKGVEKAVREDGLPEAYVFSKERMERAARLKSVEVQDREEEGGFRAEVVAR